MSINHFENQDGRKNIESIVNVDNSTKSNTITALMVIVPCFNEYKRLPFDDFSSFIEQYNGIDFCFVNDASTDNTLELLNSLQNKHPEQVLIVNLKKNGGKAEAIRQGMLFVNETHPSNFVAFLDADLSAPLIELLRLYDIIKDQRLQMVFGSRVAMYGNNIHRNVFRHYMGRFFATIASILLNMVVYDTQCGLKIFRKETTQKVFQSPFMSRWLFDIEIIARLKLIYDEKELLYLMKEIPLDDWVEKGDSKVKFSELVLIPYQLIKIRHVYRKRTIRAYTGVLKKLNPDLQQEC